MAAIGRHLSLPSCSEHLQLLEKLPADVFLRLLHEIIDGVCGRKGPDYKTVDAYSSNNEFQALEAALKLLVCEAAKNNWTKEEINNALKPLDPSIIQLLHTAIVVRREEIHQHLVNETCRVSQNSLKDFDWKVKLVLGSDKMGTIREPLISLSFDLEGCCTKSLLTELDKNELSKLIQALEGMNKAVTHLKA